MSAIKVKSNVSGLKLLVVRELDDAMTPKGNLVVAADAVGAGRDEVVLVAAGSSARAPTPRRGSSWPGAT